MAHLVFRSDGQSGSELAAGFFQDSSSSDVGCGAVGDARLMSALVNPVCDGELTENVISEKTET